MDKQPAIARILQQGIDAHRRGEIDQATACYIQVIEHDPTHAEALYLAGIIACQKGDYSAADVLLEASIRSRPGFAPAHAAHGVALRLSGRSGKALEAYDQTLQLDPKHVDTYFNRANLHKELGNFEQALRDYNFVVGMNPHHAGAYRNRALLHFKRYRLQEAIADFDNAISSAPENPENYSDRGLALQRAKQFELAMQSYNQALQLDKNCVSAHSNRAMLNLLQGNFDAGWEENEWRWQSAPLRDDPGQCRPRTGKRWNGQESLAGKSILVFAEQGLGDTLQFCRYVKHVAALGAKVVLEVPAALGEILSSLQGVDTLINGSNAEPDCDYHIPTMSLPHALRATVRSIPAEIPYIAATASKVESWTDKLRERQNTRVGLVWSSGFRPDLPERWQDNHARRNIPLSQIAALNVPNIDFFSLQKGEPAESEVVQRMAEWWPTPNFFNYTGEFQDFSDTAALIENLDLVISVDTATAHLAGAMGKPVWILVRNDACWRWLLDRTTSPWYPTARLYRQKEFGEWQQVIDEVRKDLIGFASASPCGARTRPLKPGCS